MFFPVGIVIPFCVAQVQFYLSMISGLLEILPAQQLLLVCACVYLWVNTHPICVKCEAKQAAETATWRGFGSRILGELSAPLQGGLAAKSNKGTITASAGKLGSLHQHA